MENRDAYKVLSLTKDLREGARGRRDKKPYKRKWTPLAPDLGPAKAALTKIVEQYRKYAPGGAGAIGSSDKALAALAELSATDLAAAVEAVPRWLRALKQAHKAHALTIENYVKGREWEHHPPVHEQIPELVRVEPGTLEW